MNAGNLILAQEAAPAAAPAATVTTQANGAPGAAQPPPGAMDGGGLMMGVLIIFMVAMMFLSYRGQKKEKKRRQDMIESIKKGDSVQTIGGMMGKIAELKDDSFVVEIADGVKVTFAKNAIAGVNNGEEAPKK